MLEVSEAASELGVSERYVRILLNDGRLKGQRDSWSWLVDEADLERFRRDRAAAAGPKPTLLRSALAAGADREPRGSAQTTAPVRHTEALRDEPARIAQLEEDARALAAMVSELAGIVARLHGQGRPHRPAAG